MRETEYFVSTRDPDEQREFLSTVIKKGMAPDGGLYMPNIIPKFAPAEIIKMCDMDYAGRAAKVMSPFMDDVFRMESLCRKVYTREKFGDHPAPVTKAGNLNYLELWHGPTCAFKDMALQFMPKLLSLAMNRDFTEGDACILVATSGDTGKAALEGYRDCDWIKIMVFYPSEGVSRLQKLQMVTQEGDNVCVCGIRGNFDDAQSTLKELFAEKELNLQAETELGYFLTSANSINFGRLVPQVAYYFSAYCDMINQGTIKPGDTINVCVPTGNFGNILAGYFAREMGLPINRLICASNSNNVLTDFINKGVYDKNRPFLQTISPSMDILVSSNLERLIFMLEGPEKTAKYMAQLKAEGKYKVGTKAAKKIREVFYAGYCDDDATRDTIKRVFENDGYLIDPHTAVAANCAEKYIAETEDNTPMLVVSTASAYKFAPDVLKALGEPEVACESEFDTLRRLACRTGVMIPTPITSLLGKKPRFTKVVDKEDMRKEIIGFLRG